MGNSSAVLRSFLCGTFLFELVFPKRGEKEKKCENKKVSQITPNFHQDLAIDSQVNSNQGTTSGHCEDTEVNTYFGAGNHTT